MLELELQVNKRETQLELEKSSNAHMMANPSSNANGGKNTEFIPSIWTNLYALTDSQFDQ